MSSLQGPVYAGVSDQAVRHATGRTWHAWFRLIDQAGGRTMSHPEIVAVLHKRHVGPWWQQMVAVGYERARGLRRPHQRPEGFQISATRTIEAASRAAFQAWVDGRRRGRWLPRAPMEITKATPNRRLRARWRGGKSQMDVTFTAKGSARCSITVTHGALRSEAEATRMKTYWQKALSRLMSLFG